MRHKSSDVFFMGRLFSCPLQSSKLHRTVVLKKRTSRPVAAWLVTVAALGCLATGVEASTISVFKSGTGIDMAYTTNLYSGFQSADASNVVQVTMQNQAFSTNPSTFWAVGANNPVLGLSLIHI